LKYSSERKKERERDKEELWISIRSNPQNQLNNAHKRK
jgi:hypothetical protein